MPSGRLLPENLDDRTWQTLRDQALALRSRYTPDWTTDSPGDLGITLVELFAWLTEGMIFRLNRVPERTYVEFLNLIGVLREPPVPASTMLTFALQPSAAQATVPARFAVSTVPTETRPPVVFETDEPIEVLPGSLAVALLEWPNDTRVPVSDVTPALVGVPLSSLTLDLDRQRPETAEAAIWLGFRLPASANPKPLATPFVLRVDVTESVVRNPDDLEAPIRANLTWRYSTGQDGAGRPVWSPPAGDVADGTGGLVRAGQVAIPALSGPAVAADRQWTALSLEAMGQPAAATALHEIDRNEAFAWLRLDIAATGRSRHTLRYVLFNSGPATSVVTMPMMTFRSDGTPFQSFALERAPLYRSVGGLPQIAVEIWEPRPGDELQKVEWHWTEDHPRGSIRGFRVDAIQGTLEFGNAHSAATATGNGLIPPAGTEIRVLHYRAVAAGAPANLPAGVLSMQMRPDPMLQRVYNPGPATGGSDEEPIEDAKRRGPHVLRNQNRSVTAEDYENLAEKASTSVSKVRCLEAVPAGRNAHFGGLVRRPGHVTLIVVPDAGLDVRQPQPSTNLLNTVRAFLAPRRVIGTALMVTSPRYLPIKATLEVRLWPGPENTTKAKADLKLLLNAAAYRYLHPIHGGFDGLGWQIGQRVPAAGMFTRLSEIVGDRGYVSDLSLAPAPHDYVPGDRPPEVDKKPSAVGLRIADYELACSVAETEHAVNISDAVE